MRTPTTRPRARRAIGAAAVTIALSGAVTAPAGAITYAANPAHRSTVPAPAQLSAAAPAALAAAAVDLRAYADPQLGPNVLVMKPSMSTEQIRSVFDTVAQRQVPNHFGPQRYAIVFEPGIYGSAANPLVVQVGYGTQVAGLGRTPAEVVVHGSINVYNQCDVNGCIALNNFWRSLSNLTIDVAGGEGCRKDTEFWAVSQAAPMRDVVINGRTTLMDYCTAGPQYASGGFIANSTLTGPPVVNGSQQQFFVRNTALPGWSNGVWNQMFVGSPGAPASTFPSTAPGPYTTIDRTPVVRETPRLTQPDGTRGVLVPGVRTDSAGPSATSGRVIPLDQFVIATPSSTVPAINKALREGKHLLLTPGTYSLQQTIRVSRPGTVVLGLGLPALSQRTGQPVIATSSVPGVTISGVMLDAGPKRSKTILQVGDAHGNAGSKRRSAGAGSTPTLVSDVFLRVGGAAAGSTTTAMTVDASNVILDNIWAWRADHGEGVGWTVNPADHGVVVNGDDVTAYGLFVEHFLRTEVVWNGERGRVYFFQNEKPYDVPSQSAWMMTPTFKGYPAFQVTSDVRSFEGWGMGSYSFFNQHQGIHLSTAFVAPTRPGVRLNHLLTRWLNGDGGIDSVVNGVGAPVDATNPGPSTVVSHPGATR